VPPLVLTLKPVLAKLELPPPVYDILAINFYVVPTSGDYVAKKFLLPFLWIAEKLFLVLLYVAAINRGLFYIV
jgi:hypothetical protein